ncbi:hypothetical protein ACLI1A_08885 [Flavobacterium sp. RHBU_3]|uniref:hypothetical protein n=1 Tax=Flavobacterium sp. RHBU_3 TaxID=3391184 RepID=UPI003984DFB8
MKSVNISIPKPCHENWDAMTPEDKGRFCGLCQKTVVDFTAMDDNGVASFFEQHKGQKVCGRFRTEQLTPPEKPLLPPALVNRIARRPLSSIQMFALALLVCMGTTLFSCNNTKGEPAIAPEPEHTTGAPMVGGGGGDAALFYGSVEEEKPKATKEEKGKLSESYAVGMAAPEPVDSLIENKKVEKIPKALTGEFIVTPVDSAAVKDTTRLR